MDSHPFESSVNLNRPQNTNRAVSSPSLGAQPQLYDQLRPKLSRHTNSNTYNKYQPSQTHGKEESHFSPTVRPFLNFKPSRKTSSADNVNQNGYNIAQGQSQTSRKQATYKKRYRPSKDYRYRKGLKSRRKSDNNVFKQMNEHRKKSGEKRQLNTMKHDDKYHNDNYGHPNHYEDGSVAMSQDGVYPYSSSSQDTHRHLNLKIDRHDIDYTSPKNKMHKDNNATDGDDYEYTYYYYYDYVYPDDEILQNLDEGGDWVDYGPHQKARDLSASQAYGDEYHEWLPRPMASNGTSTLPNNTNLDIKDDTSISNSTNLVSTTEISVIVPEIINETKENRGKDQTS